MAETLTSPLGVCVLPPPPRNAARTVSDPPYVHEILRHAGLCYEDLTLEELPARLPELRLLLTVGEGPLTTELRQQLTVWVADGGAWVAVGGVCGLAELFGVLVEMPAVSIWGGGTGTLGEGYLQAELASPILDSVPMPLHYFNGLPVRPAGARVLAGTLDVHQRPTPCAALTEHTVGNGCCLLIAPDLTGAVVRIQQGVAITRDGVPAPDGTASVCDGVLKSDDGMVLDWHFDRRPVEGVPGFTAFLEPIADQWRELLLRALFSLCVRQHITLPLLWLYPRGLPALAHLSHDTDGNEPEKAERLLEILRSLAVQSTWCVILPGYAPEQIGAIRGAGHELAMHFDALADGLWSESEFDRQWRKLTALFGDRPPATNKNHYLRWQNDTELLEWCTRRGIRLDQSRGASKTGEAGFNFGTCHPYLLLDPQGTAIDTLELPTPTQDLTVFAPVEILEPLLESAERHHGVLHLLFHPAHVDKPGVAAAIRSAVEEARGRGLEWWTAQQIGAWEFARRQIAWSGYEQTTDGTHVCLHAKDPLPGATILWLAGDTQTVAVDGMDQPSRAVERWGFRFQVASFDAAAEGRYLLSLNTRSGFDDEPAGERDGK